MENSDRELLDDIAGELRSIRARLSFLAYLAGISAVAYLVVSFFRWLLS